MTPQAPRSGGPDPILRSIGATLREKRVDDFKRLLRSHPVYNRWPDGRPMWLTNAAQYGRLEAVRFLVEEMEVGVDELEAPKLLAETALNIACYSGHAHVVEWLLDHGADMSVGLPGQVACFPLFSAARHDFVDIVKLLIDRGANTNFIWNGRNVLMEAECYGAKHVVQYLRSIGVRDLREITPPDYPTVHKKVRDIISRECGPIGNWEHRIPGSPEVLVQVAGPKEPGNSKFLFTIGLSDLSLPVEGIDGVQGFVTELKVPVPENWPLDQHSQNESRWNWPIRELERIVNQLRTTRVWPHINRAIFPNGDPPQPLVEGTSQHSWVVFRSDDVHQMPDYRYLVLQLLLPVYPEEVEMFLQKSGDEELSCRFHAHKVPMQVNPDRPNLADEQYALADDYFEYEDEEDEHDSGGQCEI